ncbi:uncharacterized protein LOC133805553 [Humulus lupulus]|uniref:uncharacterized protein LOC133805553 n=1 Tax=Humulus lupulus TaxID=3486 RepID=UPI002B4097B8|nr:uncharacterized protein LOC133805553 [Humulus lupulus]
MDSFFVTFVYGMNIEESRNLLWKHLQDLSMEDPWIVLGDFNDILVKEERIGARVKYTKAHSFQRCVEICQLEDVKFSGNFYTWNNKQQGQDRIYSKIDRILANQKWLDTYGAAEVHFMNEGLFDHSLAILTVTPVLVTGRKPFKYFRMWKSFPGFQDLVHNDWIRPIDGTLMYKVVQKLKRLKSTLRLINKQGFTDIHVADLETSHALTECQDQLNKDPLNPRLIQLELEARQKYTDIHRSYCSFLQQKAKLNWIQDGDTNSALFHARIRERRNQNRICSITSELGEWIDQPDMVTAAFLDYYQKLLGSKMAVRNKVLTKIVSLGTFLTTSHVNNLLLPYSQEEVKKAIWEIPGTKASGPDGYCSFFFQDNWNLVGDEVCDAILSFLHSGKILNELNSTVLTLISKSKCPKHVSDYRPIACCNVLYKAATKMICTRLRAVLLVLVAQNQGGFVKGRSIAHNIMICQDLVHHYARKVGKPKCMIKLDLRKAYDTIEWDFIEEMLGAFNFPSKFIQLVMQCVRTPKFSLMFNGSSHGFFESKRGLRPGDPMSPLLFVLGMEYLSRILHRVGSKKDFKFHARCEGIKLNHLIFADDILLFCHGDFRSIYYMLQGLQLFSSTSGLCPNQTKSAVYCSNMNEHEVQRILDASGYSRSALPFKYLGILICSKRISAKDCEVLLDKMLARIKCWSSRNISFAGQVTLINSVLLSIHSYWSQIMIIPKKVLNEIAAICRAFLWTGQAYSTRPGRIAWDLVCNSKNSGGLGFKNSRDWNIAALGKYIWAVAEKKDDLWVKWVHHVYIKQVDWWNYIAPASSSWYWKKVVEVKEKFKNLFSLPQVKPERYQIRYGYNIIHAEYTQT